MSDASITLRPVNEGDEEFLFRLYATTREDELAVVPWTPEQKEAFVRQQFDAQTSFWREHYADTSFDILEQGGEPIGRLYVGRWPEEIRIVDIALMPAWRNQGIGRQLIEGLFAEGDATGRAVSIHVEVFNPARRLYERMGFILRQDKGVYHLMERLPVGTTASA